MSDCIFELWYACVHVWYVHACLVHKSRKLPQGGELWVDQREKCADICDVAQVTDIRTLPN